MQWKMDSTEKQLTEMLREFQSRSKARAILESGFLAPLLVFLFVRNLVTLLIIALNRRMRTIPNMFVASLAISDFCLGALSSCPLALPKLATSEWSFNDAICQYQGSIATALAALSIHTLAVVVVNRFFRTVNPVKYRRYFTKTKTRITILASWLYSMCATLPYIFSGHKMVFHPSKFFCYLQIDSGAFTAF